MHVRGSGVLRDWCHCGFYSHVVPKRVLRCYWWPCNLRHDSNPRPAIYKQGRSYQFQFIQCAIKYT